MRFVRPLLATAVLLATTASSAHALKQPKNWRTRNFQFQQSAPKPAVTAFGYYVGPFTGTVLSDPSRPTINLFCVDILNQVKWGQKWTGNLTSLTSGSFDLTRHGLAGKDSYKKAAYLASQYRAAGVSSNQWGGIQAAIWNLLNPGNPNGGTNPLVNTSEAYWLGIANNWYGSNASKTFDFSRWTIVTDVGAAGLAQGGGTQEFLTDSAATPEPATLVLMGTGLLVVIGLALSRGALRV